MSTPQALLAVHKLPVYNTSRLSDEEVIAAFIGRRALFERILTDVLGESKESRAQHHLIVGQRGMGKTMLLARLAAELRKPEHSNRFVPLVFAEEQYSVDRLSKFWMNCLDSLADALERGGKQEVVDEIDAVVSSLQARLAGASKTDASLATDSLEAFLRISMKCERRPVLLVDNLQLVFERISESEQHVLRELIMRPGAPIFVGASPTPPPQTEDYGAAFYDHFKVHYLKSLSADEMQTLLIQLAEATGKVEIKENILREPERLVVLRQLTAGNPRTTVLLFLLYAEDFSPSVFNDLENLLDRVTPLYKARFEELAPQLQVVASALANNWDPMNSRLLVKTTGLPPAQISSSLDRLQKLSFVEEVELWREGGPDPKAGYQITERFFNIWFLMRNASRRQRREVEFLTKFLQSFYGVAERERLARVLSKEADLSPDRLLFTFALCGTLGESAVRHELERHAHLDLLRQQDTTAWNRISAVFEVGAIPQATRDFDQVRRRLENLAGTDVGMSPAEFARMVLGSRASFVSGLRYRIDGARITKASVGDLSNIFEGERSELAKNYGIEAESWMFELLASGHLRVPNDLADLERILGALDSWDKARIVLSTTSRTVRKRFSAQVIGHLENLSKPRGDTGADWSSWGYVLYHDLEALDSAEFAFQMAARKEPEIALHYANLGGVQISLKKYEASEQNLFKARELDAGSANVWGLFAILYYWLKRYDEAEAAVKRATDLGEDARLWCLRAQIVAAQPNRDQEVEQAYRKSLLLEASPATTMGLFDFLRGRSQWREAEKVFRDATDSVLFEPEDWLEFGRILRDHLSNPADAENAFTRALSLQSQESGLWNELGNLQSDYLAEADRALASYDKAAEIDLANCVPKFNKVYVLRDLKLQHAEALAMFELVKATADAEIKDACLLHEALFEAHAKNWGGVEQKLIAAFHLDSIAGPNTIDDWARAAAVLVHLGFGDTLVEFISNQSLKSEIRPWFEAVAATVRGDKRFLQNVAPEVRQTAEWFFDEIERRLKILTKTNEEAKRRQ